MERFGSQTLTNILLILILFTCFGIIRGVSNVISMLMNIYTDSKK